MKKQNKKQYAKPTVLKKSKRVVCVRTCCGMSTTSNCGLMKSVVA